MHFILIFLYLQTFFAEGTINYCGAKMCAHTNAHTFCRYPPGPSSSCMGYIDSALSQEDKARILARLNRRRSEAARGIRGLPTAGDMLKLRWIEELAREAQRWADQCSLPNTPEEHDICRDLYSISVGQCVASVVGEAPGLRPETMIDLWYMQSMKFRGNVTLYLPPESTSYYYSDFAQMIWSKTYMVGCGRSKFMINKHGRLRSVERLVCNFAPRGPISLRSLWLPADPATTCPPRSRPDKDLSALCTYQQDMDESYDKDNIMTLEEHLILNTIMTIERNASLDNIGVLDEIYLTKLAIATIDSSDLTPLSYNSLQKRDIVEDTEAKKTLDTEGLKDNFFKETSSNNKSTYDRGTKFYKRKGSLIGRPKAYNIEDLSDQNRDEVNNDKKAQEMTTEEKNIFDDYQAETHSDDTTSVINTLTVNTSATGHNSLDNGVLYDQIKTDGVGAFADTSTIRVENATLSIHTLHMNTEDLDIMYINDVIAHLNLSRILNDTIDENIIEEYLSNPETVRQLEESLNRMEYKLAASTPVSSKVRRELRNVQEIGQQNPNAQKMKNHQALSAEAERNKTLERGPMLNMVLKYIPYLKPYEKSLIGGGSTANINCDSLSLLSFGLIFLTNIY